jgi:signal transduction histidine kinase
MRACHHHAHYLPPRIDTMRSESLAKRSPQTGDGSDVLSALLQLCHATASVEPDAFFPTLVEQLCRQLQVDCAMASRLVYESGTVGERFEVLAVWDRDRLLPGFRSSLDGTPCEVTVREPFCFYGDRVCEIFPADSLLSSLGAVSFVGVPIADSRDTVLGTLSIVDRRPMSPQRRDVFVSVLAVMAARSASEVLHRDQAAHLAAELEDRTSGLRDLIDGLESFTRMASHDLRGPLGSIASLNELALDSLNCGDVTRTRTYLVAVAGEARRLIALVASLLDLSRVDSLELKREAFDLGEAVREAERMARQQVPHAASAMVAIGELPSIHADRALVVQALVNLLSNGLKFTSATPEPHIEISHRVDLPGTTLVVRDNGPGFDAADAKSLFQPFRRLHGASVPGSGVGLSIVRRVAERHGGRAWAERGATGGAMFFLELPAAIAGA